MAVNIVQQKQQIRGSKGKEGGSKWGAMLGAVAGGIAGAPGGPAGIIGGASTGASLGGMVGGAISPGKADTRQAIQQRATGIGQQTGQVDPQAQMKEAIMALKKVNDPELTKQYAPVLAQGLIKSSVG